MDAWLRGKVPVCVKNYIVSCHERALQIQCLPCEGLSRNTEKGRGGCIACLMDLEKLNYDWVPGEEIWHFMRKSGVARVCESGTYRTRGPTSALISVLFACMHVIMKDILTGDVRQESNDRFQMTLFFATKAQISWVSWSYMLWREKDWKSAGVRKSRWM